MSAITKSALREIIDDFVQEVRSKRIQTAKPTKTVIKFRTDVEDGHERTIWRVPIDILRLRKDNGRIASDVMDYEKNTGILRETDSGAQQIIAEFLEQKDPERTGILRKSIIHEGQNEPAIITCDGFLINGNRRKMVMDRLHKEHPQDDRFAYMKCVILPGKDEEGGPPNNLEIEILENRYQLQSDGKSEYYGFDRALSMKRKIAFGLTLAAQLRDDPQFAEASKAELDKAVKQYEKDYLLPLECVDRYLKQFAREGQYRTISAGKGDPQGRWQAFIDYSQTYTRYFSNSKKLIELGIDEEDVGAIEEAAFDIIRLRTVPDMPKVHMIMRELPKYCATREGKKAILKIVDEVDPILPAVERVDNDGTPLAPEDIDAKWAAKHKQAITYQLKKASKKHKSEKEKQTPLELLEAAYKKLTHDHMDLTAIASSDLSKAREFVIGIKDRADELESEIYRCEKEFKKLVNKSQ